MLAVARLAGKVGGLTEVFFTGLCGALPEAKGRAGGLMGGNGWRRRVLLRVKRYVFWGIFIVTAAILAFSYGSKQKEHSELPIVPEEVDFHEANTTQINDDMDDVHTLTAEPDQEVESIITMTTTARQIRFFMSGKKTATIDWGDGAMPDTVAFVDNFNKRLLFREYSDAATRTIKITGLNITELECDNSLLTALDVSRNTALKHLECHDNQLTELDVSRNTALIYLDCNNNQLTALDVSRNMALEYLFCGNNQLTDIDVSRNEALQYFYCNNNQLTALDVSNNTTLKRLDVHFNQLTALDLSKNTTLYHLTCFNNKLSASALNALYATLHDKDIWFSNKTIDMRNNSGSSNSRPDIAQTRGWAVIGFSGAWTDEIASLIVGEWVMAEDITDDFMFRKNPYLFIHENASIIINLNYDIYGVLEQTGDYSFNVTNGVGVSREEGNWRPIERVDTLIYDPETGILHVHEHSWQRAVAVNLQIQTATKEVLNQFEDFHLFEECTAAPQMLIIITDRTIRHFHLSEISRSVSSGGTIFTGSGIHAISELTPEKPFVFTWLGERRAISYRDENGYYHNFEIIENQDGSFVLLNR